MSLFDDPRRYFLAISLVSGVVGDYEKKTDDGRDGANVETNEFSGWMLSSHYRRKRENDTRAQFSRLRV